MSKTLHFIVQATAAQLAAVWPHAPRYINEHTDPWYFVHLRLTNYNEADAWRSVCDDLGYDFDNPEDFEFATSKENSADIGDYSVFLVGEDEADEWIRQAESYLTPLDLMDDDS